jgi:hypothetical protein
MTYPGYPPKGNTAKRKVKHGAPFDPEDLSKRLNIHLEKQKIQAEKRRDTRAARVAATQQDYRHIPAVAAASFNRTATPDALRQVHKLAQPAVKVHLENSSYSDPSPRFATVLQKTQAKDHAMAERNLLGNRNQFQLTRDMEKTLVVDLDRDVYTLPQRTFQPDTSQIRILHATRVPRPLSTGDMFSSEEEDSEAAVKPTLKPLFDTNDRHDWAQRDEESEIRQSKKEWTIPFSRKKDSGCLMMGRREKNIRQGKDEAIGGIGDPGSPPINKNGRGRFLARFKRQPS